MAVATCVTSLATAFDVAYDYKRPLAVVDLDFVQVVLILRSDRDALAAFVGQSLIAKHEAVVKFAKYFVSNLKKKIGQIIFKKNVFFTFFVKMEAIVIPASCAK